MTRRPADIPPEVWARLLAGQAERLERHWVRIYCTLIPKPYRRRLFWSAGWGPVGFFLMVMWSWQIAVLQRLAK